MVIRFKFKCKYLMYNIALLGTFELMLNVHFVGVFGRCELLLVNKFEERFSETLRLYSGSNHINILLQFHPMGKMLVMSCYYNL